jgi:hypothetical protein
VKRKDKPLTDLSQPLTIKLSVDGTVLNNRSKYVAYTLCAFEHNHEKHVNTDNLVLLGLLADEESYDVINHYFEGLHKQIQRKIDSNKVIIDNNVISFNFIICSDLKSLFTFMGMNSANGKYSCICCRTSKQDFCEVETFFGMNKSRSHLVFGKRYK